MRHSFFGAVYQVTSDMVSDDELGSYIDILAESVTFDTETKIPLSKEDLSKIDWYGEMPDRGESVGFTQMSMRFTEPIKRKRLRSR